MDPFELNHLGFAGHTLNVEERAGLEVAINKRRLEEGLREVLFWGKLYGEEDDYLVVYGFGASADFPRKRFYYRCGPCGPGTCLGSCTPSVLSLCCAA
jgi:hypothetical protein